MSETSVVAIEYDVNGDNSFAANLTNYALITSAIFNVSGAASPGTCEITMRDLDRELSFVTGRRLRLKVDGVSLWAGFLLLPGRGNFFPAGDGGSVSKTRKWTLRGTDNNLLLDKRVLRYPANPLTHIPFVTSDEYIGATLRRALSSYADMPGWLDVSTQIDNVALLSTETGRTIQTVVDLVHDKGPWAYPAQGSKLRDVFEAIAQISGAVYFIGPDDKVHLHAIQNSESPWGFSDRPNNAPISAFSGFGGAYWGFRELSADEDGSDFGTDALVWGGSPFAGAGGTVFHRATDATLEAVHGKWQLAETHFDETNFKTQATVTQRANQIVFGNPTGSPLGAEPGSVAGEGPRGLRFPQWQYSFSWHTRNVPVLSGVPRHLRPGDLVPVQLWAFSQDGGVTPFTKILPLRQLRISFPTGARDGTALVRFDGGFDLRNLDSKFLWSYLRRRQAKPPAVLTSATVDNSSTSAPLGAHGAFYLAVDGSKTVFTLPFGYIPLTTEVYLNGLLQRRGIDYVETNPDLGTITMSSAPLVTDSLTVNARALGGPVSPGAGGKFVGVAMGPWSGSAMTDIHGAVSNVSVATANNGSESTNIDDAIAAGLGVMQVRAGPYSSGGVQTIGPDAWAAQAVSIFNANPTIVAMEILNEPGGSWFWGSGAMDQANSDAYALLLKKVHDAFAANGSKPLLLASYDGGHPGSTTWGTQVHAADAAVWSYVDGVTVHPYGGPSNPAVSALGLRSSVADAASATGKPVWITEVGWPTAHAQSATGDSLQWTEAQQATNIYNFVTWALGNASVGGLVIFNYRDYGTNAFYGVTRGPSNPDGADGSHKKSFEDLRRAVLGLTQS